MNDFFDNQRILNFIWKRKIHFIVVGLIAIVLSAVFSGPNFIKPKFKSTARIYPTNISALSNESKTEQMLEVINSRDIKLKMLDAFPLDEDYKVSEDDPHYLTTMIGIYNANVKVSKTEFETAEIQVLDFDPQRAAEMCDSIISFYNDKVEDMHRIKNKEMLDISKVWLKRKNKELDSLTLIVDTLKNKYGILDFETQTPELTRGYMEALAAGRGSASDTKKIEQLYSNFAEEGTKAKKVESRLNKVMRSIDSLTTQYEIYFNEYEKEITYCHVVESPVPADKKAYPVRWLIVAFTTISAVFFALLVFLILDYRKRQ